MITIILATILASGIVGGVSLLGYTEHPDKSDNLIMTYALLYLFCIFISAVIVGAIFGPDWVK